MINCNHVKRGMVLNIDGDLSLVQSFQHHKPGKGAAVVRIKLKSLAKGTTLEKTFRSSETLEDIELEKRLATFSYEDGGQIIFMDTETYDEISVDKKDIGEILKFMKEGMDFSIMLHEGTPVSIIPPNFVELKVEYAEEGVKGDTATTATKEIKLETGASLQVPLFVKTGDLLKIDLRDYSYVERVTQ